MAGERMGRAPPGPGPVGGGAGEETTGGPARNYSVLRDACRGRGRWSPVCLPPGSVCGAALVPCLAQEACSSSAGHMRSLVTRTCVLTAAGTGDRPGLLRLVGRDPLAYAAVLCRRAVTPRRCRRGGLRRRPGPAVAGPGGVWPGPARRRAPPGPGSGGEVAGGSRQRPDAAPTPSNCPGSRGWRSSYSAKRWRDTSLPGRSNRLARLWAQGRGGSVSGRNPGQPRDTRSDLLHLLHLREVQFRGRRLRQTVESECWPAAPSAAGLDSRHAGALPCPATPFADFSRSIRAGDARVAVELLGAGAGSRNLLASGQAQAGRYVAVTGGLRPLRVPSRRSPPSTLDEEA